MPIGGGPGSTVHTLEARIESTGAQSFADEMSAATNSVSSLQTAVAGAGAALAGLSAGALAKATGAAMSYESAMTEVSKVTSEATANQLNEDILELSETIPMSTTQLADLAEQAGRFGIEGPEAIRNFVSSTARMAEATDVNANMAGEAFAKLTTLTNANIDEVENLGSAINSVSNNFATSSQEIVDSMMRSAASLSQLGLSAQEITGISGALNAVSESSERAGTRLRRLSQEIMAPGKSLQDLAAGAGLSAKEFENMRDNSPLELIKRMAQRMGEGGKQADLLNDALSTTSRQALAGLSENLSGLNGALELSHEEFDKATSLQEEFDKAVNTTAQQFELLKNQIVTTAIRTGQQFLPVVNTTIQYARGLVERFAEVNRRTDGMAGAIAGLSGVFVGLTTALSALAPLLGSVTVGLGAVSTALAPIAAIVGGTAAAFIAYRDNLFGVRDATHAVASAIRTNFTPVFEQARAIVQNVAQTMRAAWTQHSDAIMGRVQVLVDLLRGGLIGTVQTLAPIVQTILSGVSSFWDQHGALISDTIFTVLIFALDSLIETIRTIQTVVETVTGVVESIWSTHGERITTILSAAMGAIDGIVNGTLHGIRTTIETLTAIWEGDFETAWANIKQMVSDAISGIASFLSGPGKEAAVAALGLLIDGLKLAWEGLKMAVAGAGGILMSLIDDAVTYLTGPAVENAKAAVGTLVEGMVTAFSNLATAILGGGGEGGGGEGIIPSLFTGVADYITSIGMEDVKNAAHALGVGVRTVLLQFFEWGNTLSTVITNFITGVATYIGSGQAFEDIKSAFSLLGQGIKTTLLTFFEWGGVFAGVVTNFITTFGTYIGSGQAFEDIKAAFSLLGGGIETVLLTFFDWGETFSGIITGFITDVSDYIGSGQAYEDVVGAFGSLLDGAKAVFESFVDGLLYGSLIPDFFSDLADFIGIGGKGFSAIVGAFGDLLGWVTEDVGNWSLPGDIKGRVDDALTKVENMASNFKDAGKDLMSSVTEGLEAKKDEVKNAAEGVMGAVRDRLPGSDAKKGPLSDLTAASEALPRTLATGIERQLQPVKRAAEELASAAKPQPVADTAPSRGSPRAQVDPAALVGAAPSPEIPTDRLASAVAAGQQSPHRNRARRNRAKEHRDRQIDASRVSDPDFDLVRDFEDALENVTEDRDKKIEREVARQLDKAARNSHRR